ncbi:SH3 domain-binding protein 5 isoform X2 [Emydura macquarii macquarii]|uniref:SH3 domain-binding protein 5 isoform X2 n=1 Tax=Emydura macquarii macquarii TaxID=1129001 RepID=UPI00352A4EC0
MPAAAAGTACLRVWSQQQQQGGFAKSPAGRSLPPSLRRPALGGCSIRSSSTKGKLEQGRRQLAAVRSTRGRGLAGGVAGLGLSPWGGEGCCCCCWRRRAGLGRAEGCARVTGEPAAGRERGGAAGSGSCGRLQAEAGPMEPAGRRSRPEEGDFPAEEEEEEVDPRIQGELEKLNQSTDDINRRETELEDARQKFRSVLVDATVKLDELVKKIGKAVEDSKPYWEARRVARQAQLEAQKATQDFQRATEVLRAAKETISLAEQRLLEDDKRQFDSAWQEMLNHATQRVMEAEQTKTRSELVHKETAAKYNAAMGRMKQLEKKLKRAINKSKPYFELKAKYYVQLEQLKKTVDDLQAKLALAKGEYKTALKNLEMISDEIHEKRRSAAMGPRGCGVGSEGSNTSVEDLSACKLESDTISTSEVFEDDNCSSFVSEEDSETQSVSSFSSGPTSPYEMPTQFPPATRPASLDLPSPISLSEFGMMFPVLGPRSECSGASSPECEVERGDRAEGAENKTSNKANKNRSSSGNSTEGLALDNRMKQLSLQCMKVKEGITADRKAVQIG